MSGRIEDLIRRMSLAEKLGQLTMTASTYATTGPVLVGDSTEAIRAGTVGNLLNMVGASHVREVQRIAVEQSRLGIPLLIGFDVLHGHRTLFPIPLAEAAMFDPRAWTATAREAALEAAADGIAMTFAPMLDVARDPRWGRIAESPGEDAWLAARYAEAKVLGFQGANLRVPGALAATAKHFCAYGAVTAGRDYASVDVSERTLLEVYLPPFAAAVAAGVAAVMPAFTDLAGVPMTAHVPLLHGWLRDTTGFEGVIVSDYNAIAELVRHGVAADLAQAATLALNAGVDIDMMADAYRKGLPVALQRGWVVEAQIDAAVRRVLALKEQLGLFDDPYPRRVPGTSAAALAARRELARSAAARAIVMLKNDGPVLPLAGRIEGRDLRLAVVGPLADAAKDMRGPWAAAGADEAVTVLAGLRALLSGPQVLHAAGVDVDGGTLDAMPAALEMCGAVDAVLLCVGEAASMSGEAASRATLDLPGRQREFAEAVLARAQTLGTPVIVVLFCGRPLALPWLVERATAVLAAWFLGSEAGHAVGDVVLGRVSPSGRTPVAWPRALGQVPIFFGQRPGGRPADPADHYTSKYLDTPNEPLFPFGHGLTYGSFRYANLRVAARPVTEQETVVIRVDVTNEGAHAAEETVFLFIHDPIAQVSRPLLELKGFGKIALGPGESGSVTLLLPAAQFAYRGLDLTPVFEAGEIEILVGPCADRRQLLVAKIQVSTDRVT